MAIFHAFIHKREKRIGKTNHNNIEQKPKKI